MWQVSLGMQVGLPSPPCVLTRLSALDFVTCKVLTKDMFEETLDAYPAEVGIIISTPQHWYRT